MNKKQFLILVVAVLVPSVFNLLFLINQRVSAVNASSQSIPQTIDYQGKLTDLAGNSLTGDYEMQFCFYSDATGGTAVWCESYLNANQTAVSIVGGVFNVQLGSIEPLSNSLFSESELYLGITVGNDAEMTPRRRMSSNGFTFKAADSDTVDGSHASDFATANHTHSEINGIPSGLIALFQTDFCVEGWTRVAELDGKFLVGGDSYNAAAGGSNSHSHEAGSLSAPDHAHNVRANEAIWGSTAATLGKLTTGQDGGVSATNAVSTTGSGELALTGSSASTDSRPEFAIVILCQKD